MVETILKNSPDLTVEPAVHQDDGQKNLFGLQIFESVMVNCCYQMGDWWARGRGTLLEEFVLFTFRIILKVIVGKLASRCGRRLHAALFIFTEIIIVLSTTLPAAIGTRSVWPSKLLLLAMLKPLFTVVIAKIIGVILVLAACIIAIVIILFKIFVVERVYPKNITNDIPRPGASALNALLEYGGQSEDMMLALLDTGLSLGDINKLDGYACRIWIWATARGYLRVARRLLCQGMTVGPDDPALWRAAGGGHSDMVQFLIANDVKVNPSDPSSMEPPLLATARGLSNPDTSSRHLSVISILLDSGAAINATDANGRTALSFAIAPCAKEALILLINAGADPHIADKSGKTPLHYSACESDREGLALLIRAGADPNVADKDGMIPLHYAARASIDDTESIFRIALLITAGSDVNAFDMQGTSALTYMAWSGDCPQGMNLLIDVGADVNGGGGSYGSPLIAAARYASIDMIEMLIQAGADINFQGGKTWHSAVFATLDRPDLKYHGRFDALAVLLKHGADISLENAKGQEALQEAASYLGVNSQEGLIRILLERPRQPRMPFAGISTRFTSVIEFTKPYVPT